MNILNKIKKIYFHHKKQIYYLIAGTWNTFFGYSIFIVLYYFLHKFLLSIFIIIICNILSITNSYITYKFFVFKTKGNYIKEYLKFYLVYGIGMLFNIIMFPFLVNVLKINPYLAQAFILIIIILSSYLAHQFFTFRSKGNK